jgi:hypothetical protein
MPITTSRSPNQSSYLKFPTFPNSSKLTPENISLIETSINTCVKHLLQIRINPQKYTYNKEHLITEILSHITDDNHLIITTIIVKKFLYNIELILASLFSEESFVDLQAEFMLKYPEIIPKGNKNVNKVNKVNKIKPPIHSCCKQCCKCGRTYSEPTSIHEEILDINHFDKLLDIFSKLYYTLSDSYSDFEELLKKSEVRFSFKNILKEEIFLVLQNNHNWMKFGIYKINSFMKFNQSNKFAHLNNFISEFTSIVPNEIDKFLNFINENIVAKTCSSSSVDDILEYINNTDCSKHGKKRKVTRKKENYSLHSKESLEQFDPEVEEFKTFIYTMYFVTGKIPKESKVSPEFSNQWLINIQDSVKNVFNKI